MGVTFISRASIPTPIKGKVATEPRVTISENGQMTFSTLAMKAIGGKECKKVALAFDKENRLVILIPHGHKQAAGKPEESFWEMKHSKSGGNSAMLSCSGSFLANETVFGNDTYNYKESGGQSFPVTEKNGYISFKLPKGKLDRRPTVKRVKKAKTEKDKTVTMPSKDQPELEELEVATA